MRILVISGYCPRDNHSAALSHNAYIEGLIKLGNRIDLLCYSEKNFKVDKQMAIPRIENKYEYDGLSLYEKLALKKERNDSPATNVTESSSVDSKQNNVPSFKSKLVSKVKNSVRSLYGIYNPSIVWFRRAKRFKTNVHYDCVISMSYPQVSHLLANYLRSHKRVIADKWIQLWEDPWAADLGNVDGLKKCVKPEGKLLNEAEDIVYVSPITLIHQQELFPFAKDKMRWCPLAAYYNAEAIDYSGFKENHYGYFGDYTPYIRNLEPFYNVAVKKDISVDVCGSPSNLFPSKNRVAIYPRLPLGELKKHEDKANVVVCLFNLGGGQIPGKIYQLAATNKVILAILDGPEDEQAIIKEYFEKFNRFVFCQNNEQSISEAIDRIEANDLGDVSNEPIDSFSVEKVAKMLLGD